MTGRRLARLTAIAAVIVLPVALVLIAVPLTTWLPRSTQRQITEILLRGVLLAYVAAVALLPVFVVVAIGMVVRGRSGGRRHPLAARVALGGVSALLSLVLLEALSATWERWSNRPPRLATRFAEAAPPGGLHVVVVGGSSALGEPFRPRLSVGQVIQRSLRTALPGRPIELTILARLGASLRDMHEALARLTRRPDLLVIYSGHNEFVARYEEERDAGLREEPAGMLLDALYHLSLRSPFCRQAYRIISRNRLDGPPPRISRHRLIDPPQCSPSEYAAVRADFHRRLDGIVDWCDRIGCVPLLVIPPGNEGGLEPSRSVLPPSVGRAERQRLVAAMGLAAAAAADDPDRAAGLYREILARHPGFAEASFRLGRIEQRAGNTDAANRHYAMARDRDGLPIRCPTDFQDIYRRVAGRHPRSILIDGPAVLRAASLTGVVDDHVIQDAHHPTLLGTTALAAASLQALHARRAFGWAGPGPPSLDPSELAQAFGMDAAAWVTVCERTAVHYERIALYRFDRSERLARAAAYRAAMVRIRGGVPPEEAGVTGLGPGSTAALQVPRPGEELGNIPEPGRLRPSAWRPDPS